MVLFNYATKELTAKVVYYGPGLCGKTTNLQFIYDTLPSQAKGKMLSLATKTDRTLFFDFLPIELGTIRGMKTKIQLYTVPGQVFYDTTRKLVLKGADGVVFVADSQTAMADANVDSFENLITNLKEQNMDITNMPYVLQYNKRDMKNVMDVNSLNNLMNKSNVPWFEAVAVKGDGVFETLKGISKLVLKHLGQKYGLEEEKSQPTAPRGRSNLPELPPKPSEAPALPSPPPRKPVEAPKPAAPKPVDVPKPAAPKPAAPKPAAPKPAPPQPAPKKAPPKPAMEEIEFIEDDTINKKPIPLDVPDFDEPIELDDEPSKPVPRPARLKPIATIDNSEVIELDDIDPIEFEDDLEDMAEIASMASDEVGGPVPQPKAPVEPITLPVSINLPPSLAGKPIRLQIDILFDDE